MSGPTLTMALMAQEPASTTSTSTSTSTPSSSASSSSSSFSSASSAASLFSAPFGGTSFSPSKTKTSTAPPSHSPSAASVSASVSLFPLETHAPSSLTATPRHIVATSTSSTTTSSTSTSTSASASASTSTDTTTNTSTVSPAETTDTCSTSTAASAYSSLLASFDSFDSSFESSLAFKKFTSQTVSKEPSASSSSPFTTTTTTSTTSSTFTESPQLRPTTAPPTLTAPSFFAGSSNSSFAINLDVDIPSFDSDPNFDKSLQLAPKTTTTTTITSSSTAATTTTTTTTTTTSTTTVDATLHTQTQSQSQPQTTGSDDTLLSINRPTENEPSCPGPSPGSTILPMKTRQRSSTLDRPRSWLPTSKSAVSVRELRSDKSKENAFGHSRVVSIGSKKLRKPDPEVASLSALSIADDDETIGDETTDPTEQDECAVSAAPLCASSSLDDTTPDSPENRISRRKSVFGISFSRSQLTDSRSPSPRRSLSREPASVNSQSAPNLPSLRASASTSRLRTATRKDTAPPLPVPAEVKSSNPFSRTGGYFSRMKRPGGVFRLGPSLGDTSENASSTSLAPSLGAAASNTTAGSTTSKSASISEKSNNTATDDSSFEMPPARKPDPLKNAFRDLSTEATKFENKTVPQRMQIVRNNVLSFFQRHGYDTSYKTLCLEDMECRTNIMNRWWMLLLDLLDGNKHQSIAGVDRLPLVEAVTLIMMRPEWRQTTSYFMPLRERCPGERVRARSWTNASNSTLSDTDAAYLKESAEHNIRGMFVANLARQLEIVVDKMSQRHASLGVTNFCGKALAYAFFFVPGAAEMLVRLWAPKTNLIQRVAESFGLPRRSTGESEDIVALFPPYLSDMGWTSVRTMSAMLRRVPKMMPNLSKVQWQGPWINRWQGRDTDIFFIFCKYFHLLAQDFMPADLPLVEKARSPGFVLVHAQLLAVLDATVNRHAVLEAYQSGPPDASVDAFSATMPYGAGPVDLMKGMSENRTLKLLKDFLSENAPSMAQAKRGFGEAYAALMKATASTTSQYNQAACITLCDFLEEAFQIFNAHEEDGNAQTQYLDWEFWLKAMRLMLQSLNTMMEIRVLCLAHTVWDVITRNPERKKMFCIGWLLSEDVFDQFFNNWCPMIRAYYMRLLCWRVCRDTGSANEVDAEIFVAVSQRLKTTWSHYLYLKQEAEANGTQFPNSTPCYPAPCKKFMIIRTEVHVAQMGMMMGFDSVGRLPLPTEMPAEDAFSSLTAAAPKPEVKKRGFLASLSKAFLGGDSQDDEGGSNMTTGATGGARGKAGAGGPPLPPKGHAASPSDASSTGSSPVFEAQRYVFRFLLNWHQQACQSPPEMALVRPRLPAPAQAWVSARRRSGSQPPVPAGLPPPTRMVSGAATPGLINEARNASEDAVPESASKRTSVASQATTGADSPARAVTPTLQPEPTEASTPTPDEKAPLAISTENHALHSSLHDVLLSPADRPTTPVKPDGLFSTRAVYAGRALAEWTLVVMECNNFVERRRDEGVLGLADVEVPTLTLEPVRRPS